MHLNALLTSKISNEQGHMTLPGPAGHENRSG